MTRRPLLLRVARWGLVLLIVAAVAIGAAGLLLALGMTRAHTLTAYAAVAIAGLGILLALPAALLDKDTLR